MPLTPDTALRLHLAKAQEFWREDKLEEANLAMRNALRVGLPPGNWYDFQRMLEAELGARQQSEQFTVSADFTIEADPRIWGHRIAGFETTGNEAVAEVARTMQLSWDRSILLTLFSEDSWLDFMQARYGYYARRTDSHKICLPPSAFRDPHTFRRALRHESAHAAAHQLAGESIPRWLDEGIAVWMEGGLSLPNPMPRLTLDAISAGFERFDVDLGSPRNHLSYAAAGDFVTRQIKSHGIHALLKMLSTLSSGEPVDRAWRTTYGKRLIEAEKVWNSAVA